MQPMAGRENPQDFPRRKVMKGGIIRMDKKKLAKLLTYVGGVVLLAIFIIWFIPAIHFTLDGTAYAISPHAFFAKAGAVGASASPLYKYLVSVDADYNTNQDMYWIAFGGLFAIANTIVTLFVKKAFPRTIWGTIFSLFMLIGVAVSGALHMSALWVLYLILAIIAFASYAYSLYLAYTA
jgi:hypothetical protein